MSSIGRTVTTLSYESLPDIRSNHKNRTVKTKFPRQRAGRTPPPREARNPRTLGAVFRAPDPNEKRTVKHNFPRQRAGRTSPPSENPVPREPAAHSLMRKSIFNTIFVHAIRASRFYAPRPFRGFGSRRRKAECGTRK